MLKKRLLLLGGGHSHALFLRMWGMNPLPDVELLLVSPQSLTAYSGMLPGYLAGQYAHDAVQIDLVRLCTATQVRFIQDTAVQIDLANKQLVLAQRPPVSWDVLSINIGSEPEKGPGGLAIKPIHEFLQQEQRLKNAGSIAIVGGGAGGVEVALSLKTRYAASKKIILIQRDRELMPQAPAAVRRRLARLCRERGIEVHCAVQDASVLTASADLVLWTTGAQGPALLRNSGLPVDARGFLITEENLLCRGQKNIFATGDCAVIERQPRPRSGVYAVRLAKPLYDNIRRSLLGQPLRPVRLQTKHLVLLKTGPQEALAIRGSFYWQAPWVWSLKDRIDRRFMRKFEQLPPASMRRDAQESMRCLGCGAKVAGVTLKKALELVARRYPEVFHDAPDRRSLALSEDVALVSMQGWVMQSLDYFPAFIDDPYLLGQIACLHAAGDLLAKGGKPESCMALAVLPFKAPPLLQDDLFQLLCGVASVLQTMQAKLIGGHSAEGQQLAIGLHMQGLRPVDASWRPKGALRAGDCLVLTKALGTGLVLAGLMQQATRGRWLDRCLQSMRLNHVAILDLIQQDAVHAATDVTGFGLLGHLAEMVKASNVLAAVQTSHLPLLEGVSELIEAGVSSTLALPNQSYAESLCRISLETSDTMSLLCDPQTSGAFLLSIAADKVDAWLASAQEAGFADACIIGRVEAGTAAIHIL